MEPCLGECGFPQMILDEFIHDETGQAPSVVWQVREKHPGEEDFFDVNTSYFEEFGDWPTAQLSLSATHLKGCTMLAIISRKSICLSHYWESIYFSTDEAERPDLWRRFKSQENIFDKTVIKTSRVEVGRSNDPQQTSLYGIAERLRDSNMQAYLVHPSINDQEDGDYSIQWDQIKATIVEKFPELGNLPRWHDHPYEMVDDTELEKLTSMPKGRILFKYDPLHVDLHEDAS